MSPTDRRPPGSPGSGRAAPHLRAAPEMGASRHAEEGEPGGAAPQVDPLAIEDLLAMLRPDQPVQVRRAASRYAFVIEGLAAAASRDPDPLVRANALYGCDLREDDRCRLEADPVVRRLMSVITR